MADIFISYASEDRERVRPLAEALRRRGLKIWWDRAQAGGQDYTHTIERELAEAKVVLVVWTAGSISSGFVRDEAAKARDEERLVAVLLDPVETPLGFASHKPEDFTRWTGAGGARQVQVLAETLKARADGRDVRTAKRDHGRRRWMTNIRVLALIVVVLGVLGVAVGSKLLTHIAPQQSATADPRLELLHLLEEGKLSAGQAGELATILAPQALAGLQTVSASQALPTDQQIHVNAADGSPAAQALFAATAQAAYTDAMAALLLAPEAEVRQGAAQMADPAQRDSAIEALWSFAQAHPDKRTQIYRAVAVVGEANANARGPEALSYLTRTEPLVTANWLMLAHAEQRTGHADEAVVAGLVSDALTAQQSADTAAAEQNFSQALPKASAPQTRAFVASQLGAIAEARRDFNSASARYAAAYRASEQAADSDDGASLAALQANAQHFVTALDRSGRTRDACEQLQLAQVEHDVEAPAGDLVQRCTSRFHVQLRPAQ